MPLALLLFARHNFVRRSDFNEPVSKCFGHILRLCYVERVVSSREAMVPCLTDMVTIDVPWLVSCRSKREEIGRAKCAEFHHIESGCKLRNGGGGYGLGQKQA